MRYLLRTAVLLVVAVGVGWYVDRAILRHCDGAGGWV